MAVGRMVKIFKDRKNGKEEVTDESVYSNHNSQPGFGCGADASDRRGLARAE